jgi:hypothetical protein
MKWNQEVKKGYHILSGDKKIYIAQAKHNGSCKYINISRRVYVKHPDKILILEASRSGEHGRIIASEIEYDDLFKAVAVLKPEIWKYKTYWSIDLDNIKSLMKNGKIHTVDPSLNSSVPLADFSARRCSKYDHRVMRLYLVTTEITSEGILEHRLHENRFTWASPHAYWLWYCQNVNDISWAKFKEKKLAPGSIKIGAGKRWNTYGIEWGNPDMFPNKVAAEQADQQFLSHNSKYQLED